MNESRAIAGPAPYSIWSGTPYHFHFNSRTREACDSPTCRDSTRREHVAICSGVRSADRLPTRSGGCAPGGLVKGRPAAPVAA